MHVCTRASSHVYGMYRREDEAALLGTQSGEPEGGGGLEEQGAARRRIAIGVRVAEKARLGRRLEHAPHACIHTCIRLAHACSIGRDEAWAHTSGGMHRPCTCILSHARALTGVCAWHACTPRRTAASSG